MRIILYGLGIFETGFHALTDCSQTHCIIKDGLEFQIPPASTFWGRDESSILRLCSVGDWSQGVLPAMQGLYQLSYISNPWCFHKLKRWWMDGTSHCLLTHVSAGWSFVLTLYPSLLVLVANDTLVSPSLIMGLNVSLFVGLNIKLVSVNFEEISTHFICGCLYLFLLCGWVGRLCCISFLWFLNPSIYILF